MSDKKVNSSRLGKNILSLGLVQIANYILPLISIPIVSRIIGPEKFGVINFVQAFVAYFMLLISYGFNLTATRRLAASPNDTQKRNQVFSEVLTAQSILLLVSFVIFMGCLFFVPELKNEWLVSLFTFSACFGTLLTQNWLFQAMQDLPKVAILNFVSKFIFILLILLMIHKRSDYILYALSLSISQVAVAIFSIIWSIRRYNLKFIRISLPDSLKLIWDERTYFISLVIVNLYTTTNIVLLGFMTDSTQVGYYSAGQKISSIIMSIFILPFRQTFFPHVSKELSKDLKKGIQISQKLLPIIIWPTFLLGLGTLVCSKFIILFLYGKAFLPALIVLRIFAFLPMILGLSNIWGIIVMMNLNLDKIYLRITMVSAAASIILNVVLIPYWSYVGSAIALMVTQSLGMLLIFFYLKKLNLELIDLSYFNPFKLNKLIYAQFKR